MFRRLQRGAAMLHLVLLAAIALLVFLVALVAWLPRVDIILSATLAVLGTVQIALASETQWVGALHPLGALFVLVLVTVLLRRRRGAWTAGRALKA